MSENLYSMHITFADGSNPWVKFNMTRAEYGFEVNLWAKEYELQHLRESFGIHYFLAKNRKKEGLKDVVSEQKESGNL